MFALASLRSIQAPGRIALVTTMAVALTACSSGPYQIELMPAPAVYEGGAVDPFTDTPPLEMIPYEGILYATDRQPSETVSRFYEDRRGHELRLGIGTIEIGEPGVPWEETRRCSLLRDRSADIPLRVTGVKELGILADSYTALTPTGLRSPEPEEPGERFAALVDEKLATSTRKDVYIYVHGYRVNFDDPLLVAAELWHFLGYDGVFIAYAWPSTPSVWAYLSDLETAAYTARNLRILVQYLSRDTRVERIHIIGYSAGTRVVISALDQLSLLRTNQDLESIRAELRLGHVILAGSDFDPDLIGGYLADGLLKIPGVLTVYVSGTDAALGMSEWIFGRGRLGQFSGEPLDPILVEFLRDSENLRVIDVTKAERAGSGNGHHYFRNSPWASSDILMTLMHDLSPEERGLKRTDERPIWSFPEDYIQQLRAAVERVERDPRRKPKEAQERTGGDAAR